MKQLPIIKSSTRAFQTRHWVKGRVLSVVIAGFAAVGARGVGPVGEARRETEAKPEAKPAEPAAKDPGDEAYDKGEYDKALEIWQKAAAALKKDDDPMAWADAQEKVGEALLELARYKEAEPLLREVLRLREEKLGKEDPKIATALNDLAQLLRATNRLAEAEPLMRRALDIDEASFGKDHPDVSRDLNNLALLLKATNRLEEAEPMYRRALAIDEASFGKDHPNVAPSLSNLARLLQDTNRLDEAEPLMVRALGIAEASFGKDHPDVAIGLNNLATLYFSTNRLAEAEPLMRRMVGIVLRFQAQNGQRHPHMMTFIENYLLLCRKMKVALEKIHTRLEEERVKAGLEKEAFEEIWMEVLGEIAGKS